MVNHPTHWCGNAADASFDDHAEMILKEVESVHKVRARHPSNFLAQLLKHTE